MSKTNRTIDLLERSPTRINLPVKIKSPRIMFHKATTVSDIQRSNGYKVNIYGYRERKALKNQCNSLFTLSNQLLLSSKQFESHLNCFNCLNPLCISTDVIGFIQENNGLVNRTFRDYIVSSYKSKSVIITMRELLNNPEFTPRIKCQIDVVNTNSSNFSRTPRQMHKKSTLDSSTMNTTHNITRLQKEKLGLKESRLHHIMSKSPSYTHIKERQMNTKKKKTYSKTNTNKPITKNISFVLPKQTNEKENERYCSPKMPHKNNNNINFSVNASDNPNSTIKKLQVLKDQLRKMKTSSREMKLGDSDSDNDNERKVSNNLPGNSHLYFKTEVDSNEDVSSYNSKPLYSVIKGYLDEK